MKTSVHRTFYRCEENLNWQREAASPLANLLSQVNNLLDTIIGNLGLEVLELVSLLWQFALDLLAKFNAGHDISSHSLEVVLAEAT